MQSAEPAKMEVLAPFPGRALSAAQRQKCKQFANKQGVSAAAAERKTQELGGPGKGG